jgi:HK97 family phage major capsid protein
MPILPVEYTPAIGNAGDLVLGDFSQFIFAERDPETLSSIHVKFLEDETAFKLRFRADGHPAWATPLTQRNAALSVSPFVTLAARS